MEGINRVSKEHDESIPLDRARNLAARKSNEAADDAAGAGAPSSRQKKRKNSVIQRVIEGDGRAP